MKSLNAEKGGNNSHVPFSTRTFYLLRTKFSNYCHGQHNYEQDIEGRWLTWNVQIQVKIGYNDASTDHNYLVASE